MNTGNPLDKTKQPFIEDKYIPPEQRKYDTLDLKLKSLTANGKSYADNQREDTLSRIPKIELPDWAKEKER